jgi:hypothetical protein
LAATIIIIVTVAATNVAIVSSATPSQRGSPERLPLRRN